MTSEEIRILEPGETGDYGVWLKEIAYHLAVLSELAAKSGIPVILCASNDDIPVRIKE